MGTPHYPTQEEVDLHYLGYYSPDDVQPKEFDWWYDQIKSKKGRTSSNAVRLLSRLMFFERLYPVRDIHGNPLGFLSRCSDGYISCCYDHWAEMLHCGVRSAMRAASLLRDLGLIEIAPKRWSAEKNTSAPVAMRVMPQKVLEVLGTPTNPVITRQFHEFDLYGEYSQVELAEFVSENPARQNPSSWLHDNLAHPTCQNGKTAGKRYMSNWQEPTCQNGTQYVCQNGTHKPNPLTCNDSVVVRSNEPVGKTETKPNQTRGAGWKTSLGDVREELSSESLKNLSEDEYNTLWDEVEGSPLTSLLGSLALMVKKLFEGYSITVLRSRRRAIST